MPPDPNGVFISMKDIYDELVKVKESIQTLTSSIESYKGTQDDHDERIKDHENRIRSLEAWKYALPSSIFLAIASLIITIYNTFGR